MNKVIKVKRISTKQLEFLHKLGYTVILEIEKPIIKDLSKPTVTKVRGIFYNWENQ